MHAMRRHVHFVVIAIVLSFALVGCADKNQPATETQTQTQTKTVQVSKIELGKSTDANKRVTQQVTTFAPSDPIYASVITSGSGTATELRARWTFEDGQVVDETVQTISPSGEAASEFHIMKPDGWAPGRYKLEVFLDNQPAGTMEFDVKS